MEAMEYQNAVHVDSLEGISGDVNEEDDQEEYNELEEFEKRREHPHQDVGRLTKKKKAPFRDLNENIRSTSRLNTSFADTIALSANGTILADSEMQNVTIYDINK